MSFTTPKYIFPSFLAFIILSITGSHSNIMIGKIILLLGSFSLLLAVVSFIFSKDIYNEILAKTYMEGFNIGGRINLKARVFLLILPVILASILMLALLGYSSSVKEKEEVLFYTYNKHLNEYFDTSRAYSYEEVYDILSNMQVLAKNDTLFIISKEGQAVTVTGKTINDFVIEYTLQLSEKYNGRIYDSYGVDAQGTTLVLHTSSGEEYFVGILYEVIAQDTLTYLVIAITFLISITLIILNIFAQSLSNNINQITLGFEHILDYSDTTSKLPIISNDEIGDLTKAFNDIQDLNTELLQNIKDNQSMLIEKERLASLGQMIGGIAHNLKTPIFSISGGLAGLNDLIEEFDSSIEDPTVNNQDMHDIAHDMKVWTEKLQTHISYMSDVITAVKGQAVTLSEDSIVDFNVEELFKHIDILMKHEVKNALITLNMKNNVDNDKFIKGNINSLVQVINNIISNAIEAYQGKPNQVIDVLATSDDKNITISITDYGPGIPPEVKEKLFKEMITTKGKNGTGLGLFMSYSMIKAKFNGDITYETSENGTSFYINLPI